jgi:hypothetical protein
VDLPRGTTSLALIPMTPLISNQSIPSTTHLNLVLPPIGPSIFQPRFDRFDVGRDVLDFTIASIAIVADRSLSFLDSWTVNVDVPGPSVGTGLPAPG